MSRVSQSHLSAFESTILTHEEAELFEDMATYSSLVHADDTSLYVPMVDEPTANDNENGNNAKTPAFHGQRPHEEAPREDEEDEGKGESMTRILSSSSGRRWLFMEPVRFAAVGESGPLLGALQGQRALTGAGVLQLVEVSEGGDMNGYSLVLLCCENNNVAQYLEMRRFAESVEPASRDAPWYFLRLARKAAVSPKEDLRRWCGKAKIEGPVACNLESRADCVAQLEKMLSRVIEKDERFLQIDMIPGAVARVIASGAEFTVLSLLVGGAVVVNASSRKTLFRLAEVELRSPERCVATKASDASGGALRFQVGDTIHILSRRSNACAVGFWIGACGSQVGPFLPSFTNATASSRGLRAPAVNAGVANALPLAAETFSNDVVSPLLLVSPAALQETGRVMEKPNDVGGFNAMVATMLKSEEGLRREEKKKARGKKLKKPVIQCWEGTEAVSWLCSAQNYSRIAAIELMQKLLDGKLIVHATDPSIHIFADDGDIWRFQCDGAAPPLNTCFILHKTIPVRSPSVVVKCLLDFLCQAVVPYVRFAAAGIELDYFKLRASKKWSEFEIGVCELQRVNLQFSSGEEAVIFWINLYNLLALHSSIVNKGLVTGGWNSGFFTDSAYLIHGAVPLTLFQIHSGILHQNSKINPFGVVPFSSGDPFSAIFFPRLAVKRDDPRYLFVLCGCFKDSPPLRLAFDVGNLDSILEAATTEYLEERVIVDLTAAKVTVPGIMQPFVKDKDQFSLLTWVAKFLPPERRQALLFLASQSNVSIKFEPVSFDLSPPSIRWS